MGTRADFYIGRGEKAEWLGSIAWDGYPDGIDKALKDSKDENSFRSNLHEFLSKRKDVTFPHEGWPWPWDNSCTTDYTYAFDEGEVFASCFGSAWFKVNESVSGTETKGAFFPDMKHRKNVAKGSEKSGIFIVSTTSEGRVTIE